MSTGVRISLRGATAERWSQVDEVLIENEIGYEQDTGKFKIGNGSSPWHLLPYFINEDGIYALIEGIGAGFDLRVGDLSDLTTEDKDTIVAAINNVNSVYIPLRTLYNNAKAG